MLQGVDPVIFGLQEVHIMNMSALSDLSVEQRLHLVEELWDSIAADQGALELTDAQRQKLDQRLDAYEADGKPGDRAENVIARVRQKL